MDVRCQQNLLFSSQTCRGFESELLSFDGALSIYWISPSHFSAGTSLFWLSPSRFFESDLLSFDSVLPIYRVGPCHIWVGSSVFWLSPSRFFWVGPSLFWLSPSHFLVGPSMFWLSHSCFFFNWTLSILNHPIPLILSVLAIFFTASFPLLPPLCSDLVAMCTVDKINDGGLCRRRLLHYLEEKIEIVLPENLIKVVIRDKKKERKTK